MKTPTRILRANGVSQAELASFTGQSIQYVSMQLNGHRVLTTNLVDALRELLPLELADQIIQRRGEA